MEAPGLYDDWTGNVVNGADVRSLDIGAVRAARAAYRERFPDRSEESQGWDDATFLSRAGAFKRGKVTVAAMILLGKQDAGILPSSVCIRWRLLDPDGAVQDQRTFQGPMLLASSQAVSMVRNWTCPVGSGEDVRQVSAYRNSSLLEAVRNAVAHQDFALGGTVDVIERESESVTVVSRGSFPARSPESFISGPPQSKPPRNQFLVSAMAGMGVVPASGTGIRSMYVSQASRRFPMPDFDISDDRVAVRFPGIRAGAYARVLDVRDDLDLRTMMDLDRLAKLRYVPERRVRSLARRGLVEVMDGVPCIASGAGQDVLSAFVTGTDEDAVLALIDRNGSVTRGDVADILAARDPKELSPEQVRTKATNLLQSMRRRGLIGKSDGSTRSARYVRIPSGDPSEPTSDRGFALNATSNSFDPCHRPP
ncbi:MAG: ATP-binding protein [Thermoplasmata archaeon]|nr:ATP-binding protein [Thermoplasmata archaeon]